MVGTLTSEQYQVLMRSQRALLKAAEWAAEVQSVLAGYFAELRVKAGLAVSFTAVENGLGALLETPFGEGRVVAVNSLGEDRVQIRYIFEKAVSFEDGRKGYVWIAEIRIDADGIVCTEDGKQLADMNSFHVSEASQAVREAGLAMVYAFGKNAQYFVTDK